MSCISANESILQYGSKPFRGVLQSQQTENADPAPATPSLRTFPISAPERDSSGDDYKIGVHVDEDQQREEISSRKPRFELTQANLGFGNPSEEERYSSRSKSKHDYTACKIEPFSKSGGADSGRDLVGSVSRGRELNRHNLGGFRVRGLLGLRGLYLLGTSFAIFLLLGYFTTREEETLISFSRLRDFGSKGLESFSSKDTQLRSEGKDKFTDLVEGGSGGGEWELY